MNEDKIYLYSTPSRGTIFPSKLRPAAMLVDDVEKPMPKYMGPDKVANTLNYGWPEKVMAEHRGLGKSSFNGEWEAEHLFDEPASVVDTFADSLDTLKYRLQQESFSPYPVGSKENPLLVHHSLVCYAKQKLKLHVRTIDSDRLGDTDGNS